MKQMTETHNTDFDMEFLCSLPTFPDAALLSDLKADFPGLTEGDFSRAMRRLRDMGIEIFRRNSKAGRVMGIAAVSSEPAKRVGDEYWKRVYGW